MTESNQNKNPVPLTVHRHSTIWMEQTIQIYDVVKCVNMLTAGLGNIQVHNVMYRIYLQRVLFFAFLHFYLRQRIYVYFLIRLIYLLKLSRSVLV